MSESPADTKVANDLRKQGNIDAALPIYEKAWTTVRDKFAAAGLVNCLRKQRRFEEAIAIATEAYGLFPDFDWCRNEYIWSLIQGRLYGFPEDGSISGLLDLVDQILLARPDEIAYKITVFKLVKIARKQENWPLLNEWIVKIDPASLDGESDEAKMWSYQELWYYYRVTGLLRVGEHAAAVDFIDSERQNFRRKNKFFERLRAHGLIALERYDDADKSYRSLMGQRTDWWLLDEYGRFLVQQGREEEGLQNMIKAAMSPPMKLELKVGLFAELGKLLEKRGNTDQALAHYRLTKLVRDEQGWSSSDVSNRIAQLDGDADSVSKRDAVRACEAIWKEYSSGHSSVEKRTNSAQRQVGKIININEGRPFCFVRTQTGESFFCSKDDLPEGVTTDTSISFELRSSYDRKKDRKTFQAANIQIVP